MTSFGTYPHMSRFPITTKRQPSRFYAFVRGATVVLMCVDAAFALWGVVVILLAVT